MQEARILAFALDEESRVFYITDNLKRLLRWPLEALTSKAKSDIFPSPQKELNLPKRASKLVSDPEHRSLLLCDKLGDVYEFLVDDVDKGGRLLLGHCSMLTDMVLHKKRKLLVTCDRDEKIRVSHYPETFDIRNFSLAHSEFISGLDFLEVEINEFYVSGSGDGHICVWDLDSGRLALNYSTFEEGNPDDFCDMPCGPSHDPKAKTKRRPKPISFLKAKKNQLIYGRYSDTSIYCLKFEKSDQLAVKKHVLRLSSEQNWIPRSACWFSDEEILLLSTKPAEGGGNQLKLTRRSLLDTDDEKQELLWEGFSPQCESDEFPNLFKSWEARIEEGTKRRSEASPPRETVRKKPKQEENGGQI